MSKRKNRHIIRNKGQLLPFIKLHRWAGLSSFVLLVVLAITGIMLNHTEQLNLDEQYINTPWLQSWYGIKMPEQQTFFKLGDDLVAQVGNQLYFNQLRLPDDRSLLLGAYKTSDFIIIGMKQSLYLLTPDGELIEKLDTDKDLPIPISRIGLSDINTASGKIIIEVDNKLYTSEDDFLSWNIIQDKVFYPFILDRYKPADTRFYQTSYLGNELTLERVVLDLHSGRLFGSWGVYLMDMAAVILIMLGFSGLWVWSRRLRKK